ncbi:MAG: potassium transporter [Gammaproteobacteria bacterium]|nr:potassium transporter [Gammaproteobacteria bacterium]
MAAISDLDRVSSIVLRFMRAPILVLLATYTVGISGMALMPGQVTETGTTNMNLFHAFYFFTYTATTTGFGEIPVPFSEAQRLWATICLYFGVIAWLYAIGSMIKLAQHPELLTAIAERRFARRVQSISESFFIICGFGDTGSLLARGLSENYCAAVVIDSDTERIKALNMRDYRVKMAGLCADSSVPKHLLEAGVKRSNCAALVALTSSEDTNLKIAVMARSLNPSVQIICRSTNQHNREHLETLGGVGIVDPYEIFSRQLRTAIRMPMLYTWEEWLVGVPDIYLEQPVCPPHGKWILCGYGRMGSALYERFAERKIPTMIVDPDNQPADPDLPLVVGRAGISTLKAAGISDSAGVVAGTDSDEGNLGILLAARRLNPDAFLVVRQNRHENELAFTGADANLIMQPSLITARRILLMLTAPLMLNLREYLRYEGQHRVRETVDKTRMISNGERHHLWTERLGGATCAVSWLRSRGMRPTLGNAMGCPTDRSRKLSVLPLVLKRAEILIMLPGEEIELLADDEILFCGTEAAHRHFTTNLNNSYTLHYLHLGEDEPRGLIAKWLLRATQ